MLNIAFMANPTLLIEPLLLHLYHLFREKVWTLSAGRPKVPIWFHYPREWWQIILLLLANAASLSRRHTELNGVAAVVYKCICAVRKPAYSASVYRCSGCLCAAGEMWHLHVAAVRDVGVIKVVQRRRRRGCCMPSGMCVHCARRHPQGTQPSVRPSAPNGWAEWPLTRSRRTRCSVCVSLPHK